MNYEEQVEYMPGFEIDNDTIKKYLTEISLKGFFNNNNFKKII